MINQTTPLTVVENTCLSATLVHRILLISTLILGTLTASTLHAATTEEQPWYQVNIIIFERVYSSENEYWSKDQPLIYPKNMIQLTTPNPQKTTQNGSTNQDRYTQPSTHIKQDITFTPEQPFTRLDDEKGLQDTARRLRNARNYRVLFHESWRQPLQALNKSPAILIKGGDIFDDQYALNGTITLGIGRYLHTKTHLWLTAFEANFGQETGAWPALPRPPNYNDLGEKPADDNNRLDHNDLVSHTAFSHHNNNKKQTRFDEKNVELNLDGSLKTQPFSNTDIHFSDTTFDNEHPVDHIINKRYVIKNITALNQTRRMRSNEIHYIDHPKFGVIVNMTRYEQPKDTLPKDNTDNTLDGSADQNIEISIPTPSLGF